MKDEKDENVKDENNNSKNSTALPNSIKNFAIEDDKIMVSFGVTSLDTSIPIIDRLNIIKDRVNNDDQLTGRMSNLS